MSSMPTLVVIPTYNERHNIADLAKTIIALNDDVSVLVIDDSSPDGTASVVQ
jgi:dolichol-phosphate mannosyltransferase